MTVVFQQMNTKSKVLLPLYYTTDKKSGANGRGRRFEKSDTFVSDGVTSERMDQFHIIGRKIILQYLGSSRR